MIVDIIFFGTILLIICCFISWIIGIISANYLETREKEKTKREELRIKSKEREREYMERVLE